ncbi:MAG TPA: 3-oxoacyl-ACP reductase family protein [Anaerolineales bacterium]|nr:3-oxoacyl-ACP reductase family protein [Anaerolineales bacterium]
MSLAKSLSLAGKVALVTGGGQGIGRTLCLALAEAGADIAVADILLPPAEQTAADIQAMGRKSLAIEADVGLGESVRNMVAACVEGLGRLDILVNNAGIFPIAVVALMSEAEWDRVMDINLKGVFLCSQAALAPLRQSGSGRIINLASVSGLVGAVGMAAYAASKAGVVGFTKSLAREVAPSAITVNAIAPGIILTEQAKHNFPPSSLQAYTGQVPLGRLGTPDDLSAMVVFMASDAAAYVTGQVYAIDGGYTMQ